jgi:hypothetical protein
MSKHTPGPWFSQYDDNGFYEIGSEIVSLRLAFTYGEGDTDEANARLISAAPELLQSLQAIVRSLADQDDEGLIEHAQPMIDARAAIAKAIGEGK